MLEVRLLGPIEIAVGGDPVAVTPAQARIIAVLARSAPAALEADRLADCLWKGSPPPSAVSSLRAQIARIRQRLGADAVATDGGRYRLGPHTTDVTAVSALLEAGDAASVAAARAMFRGATDLDLPCLDSLSREIDELKFAVDVAAARMDLEAGRADAVVATASEMVRTSPLRPEPWLLLADAHHRLGHVPDALRALTGGRDAHAEVGLDPPPELVAMEDRLLVPARAHAPAPPDLVGRGSELSSIERLLTDSRIVTLTGPGGVGKTSLARAVAVRTGAGWCDLSGLTDDGDVAVAMCRALGAPPVAPYVDTLIAYLASSPGVVVLDNCEHVLEGVSGVVTRVIGSVPGVVFLATSREPLAVAAERIVVVPPLDPFDECPQLFRRRLSALGVDPDVVDAGVIIEICRRLDGLPLAVEMAAARASLVGVDETVQLLEDSVTGLGSHRRDSPERHRSIAALVDASLDALAPAERHDLTALSAFRSVFDVRLAASALGAEGVAVHERLGALVQRSLLQRVAPGRFRMLEVIRARLAELAPEAVEESVIEHIRVMAQVAQRGPSMYGPDERQWLDAVDDAIDDFRAAVFEAVARGLVEVASGLLAGLFAYSYERIRADVAEWAERVLPGLSGPEWLRVAPLAALASIQRRDLDRALDLTKALREGGGTEARWFADWLGSEIAFYGNRFEESRAFASSATETATEQATAHQQVISRLNLAMTTGVLGHTDEALEILSHARERAVATGSDILGAWVDLGEGEILAESDPVRALSAYKSAMSLSTRSGGTFVLSTAASGAAAVLGRMGDATEAAELYEQAIRHFRRHRDWVHLRVALRNLGVLYAGAGDPERAAGLLAAVSNDVDEFSAHERERIRAVLGELGDGEGVRAAKVRGRSMSPDELAEWALDGLGLVATRDAGS